MDWFEQLDTGYLWLIGALLLSGMELVLPGVFLIWIAVAAALTGVTTLLLGVPTVGQLMLFSLLSIAAVYSARKKYQTLGNTSADPLLNDRGGRLTGEIVTVVEAIRNGHGRVKVGDGVWSARGADAGVGASVRVTGTDGSVLLVERV